MRFLGPQPRLSSRLLDYLTAVDHIRHEALIAVAPETGQSLGTARYVRSDDRPETAEFAIGVGDRWMRIGLGTALLCALVLRAREVGVIRFTGLIHAENTAIRCLVEKVVGAYEIMSAGQGAMEVAVDLRAGRARTAESRPRVITRDRRTDSCSSTARRSGRHDRSHERTRPKEIE
jgi:hypothetical protein